MLEAFYYFAFSAVLLPLLITTFFIYSDHSRIDRHRIKPLIAATTAFLIAPVFAFWNVRYIVLGADGIKNLSTHDRAEAFLHRYSAHIGDYFKAIPGTLWHRLLTTAGINFTYDSSRGEVLAYLGGGLLFAMLVTFVSGYLAARNNNSNLKWRRFLPLFSRATGALLLLTVVTMYFSTDSGGIYIHRYLSKGLRCFVRLAPFSAAFLAAAIATHWRERRGAIAITIAVITLVLSVAETKTHPATEPFKSEVNSVVGEKLFQELRQLCAKGSIQIMPAMDNFILGNYILIYLTAKAECQVDGIGPITYAQINDLPKAAGIFRWDPSNHDNITSLSIEPLVK
jgi:hypothetical protein